MYCGNCLKEYNTMYDSCPECTKKAHAELKIISSRLFVVTFLLIVSALLSLFTSCNAFFVS